MSPGEVLTQLLRSKDSKYQHNIELLQKIILTSFYGRLCINGEMPDQQYKLSDYLLDQENLIFDFRKLSHEKKKQFYEWLLKPHLADKKNVFLNRFGVNTYRGYFAEVELSWWGKFKSWLLDRKCNTWELADIALSLNYQLKSLNIYHNPKGLLIHFEQFLPPSPGAKYYDPNSRIHDAKGNNKRVFVTDNLVEHLINMEITHVDYSSICNNAHPQSINVAHIQQRYQAMHDYRRSECFISRRPWYLRLFNWLLSFFKSSAETESVIEKSSLEKLIVADNVRVYKRNNQQILVTEIKPDAEIVVWCGGGAKIFAHIGVFDALCKAGIKPVNYAGSSAGAVMAMLCYLGYESVEIIDFFNQIRQEDLILYNPGWDGLSDTSGMKNILDYMLYKKLYEICKQHDLPFPEQKITYRVLDEIRKKATDCGIGDKLIVTTTEKSTGKAEYYSLHDSPDFEVTLSVAASACLPGVFKPVLIGKELHVDGGLSGNFPTDPFKDDYSTLIESEDGCNLKLIAVQFDNGTERNTLDFIRDRVYRENPFVNWLYQLITGVNDPASAWEQDRIKLRQHALQTIIVKADVSMSNFSPSEQTKRDLFESGAKAAEEYINIRYAQKDKTKPYANRELLYARFNSLADLLSYCCYRGNYGWFKTIYELIENSDDSKQQAMLQKADQLEKLYFPLKKSYSQTSVNVEASVNMKNPYGNLGKNLSMKHCIRPFLSMFPLFLRMSSDWFADKGDKQLLEDARKAFKIDSPYQCLDFFCQTKGKVHVAFFLIRFLIQQLKEAPQEQYHELFRRINEFLKKGLPKARCFYQVWNLNAQQCEHMIEQLANQNINELTHLCKVFHTRSLKKQEEETLGEQVNRETLFDEAVSADLLIAKAL